MARALVNALVGEEVDAAGPGPQPPLCSEGMWTGRITLELLKSYPDRRLPFPLAPRYKPLFAKRVHRRRTDLLAAA